MIHVLISSHKVLYYFHLLLSILFIHFHFDVFPKFPREKKCKKFNKLYNKYILNYFTFYIK